MTQEIDPECLDIINEILGDDDMINDCFQKISKENPKDTNFINNPKTNTPTRSFHHRGPSCPNEKPHKCIQICVGGTDLTPGFMKDSLEPHFCNNLFCLSCDHPVLRFADCRWDKSTNYLFLRNNYPETVKTNLYHAHGWCAYCCQCTFCEEQKTRKLPPYSSNWICRGHF